MSTPGQQLELFAIQPKSFWDKSPNPNWKPEPGGSCWVWFQPSLAANWPKNDLDMAALILHVDHVCHKCYVQIKCPGGPIHDIQLWVPFSEINPPTNLIH